MCGGFSLLSPASLPNLAAGFRHAVFVNFAQGNYITSRRCLVATMTVNLPEPVKAWIEAQISRGEYADASDYVGHLIRRDRERRASALTLRDVQEIVADAKASGNGSRSVDQIFGDAEKAASAINE